METTIGHFGSTPDIYYILILAIATGLGIYGLVILFSLNKPTSYRSPDQQVDRLLVGSINIALSIISICVVVNMIQVDNNQLFAETNRLLGQIK